MSVSPQDVDLAKLEDYTNAELAEYYRWRALETFKGRNLSDTHVQGTLLAAQTFAILALLDTKKIPSYGTVPSGAEPLKDAVRDTPEGMPDEFVITFSNPTGWAEAQLIKIADALLPYGYRAVTIVPEYDTDDVEVTAVRMS